MLLLPSIFHGFLGLAIIAAIAISLFAIPVAFAEESTWKIRILEGASEVDSSRMFYPDELPVSVGDTIEWINEDSVTHSITSGLPEHPDYHGHFFYPGAVEPNQSILLPLTDSGHDAYYYLCEIHPWMTGKIFVAEAFMAQPETDIPIAVNGAVLQIGKPVMVSGKVHQDFWGTEYEILVYDTNNELVDVKYGNFDENSEYSHKIETNSEQWKENNMFQVKLVYALPSKVAQASFEFSENTNINNESIPDWIKNVGDYWCNDEIDNSEFVNAIQFLIEKNIISIDESNSAQGNFQQVPDWVKSNTCWWSENQISDLDFLSGIEFLVNKGTIRV